jgi:type VI secretion system protein ImpJ
MLKLPNVVNRVHWSEGMLLSPQHFQHADNHRDALNAHLLRRTCRFYWGVNHFQIDEIALASNVLSILAIECVFPDGTIAQFDASGSIDGSNPQRVTLALDEIGVAAGSSFTVNLGVAKYNPKCASDVDSDLTRYVSVNEGVIADIGQPDSQIELVSLQPRLRLSLAEQSLPNHSTFPLMKLRKSLDGSFQLLPFTPPLLSAAIGYASKDQDLWVRLSHLIGRAREKAVQLRSLIVDRRSDQVVLDLQRTRIIALTHCLASLDVLLGSEAHPFEIYCRLLDYASDLATLREDPVPPSFARYRHNELDQIFAFVLDYIAESIDNVQLDYTILQFSAEIDGNYVCELPQERSSHVLYLAFQVPAKVDKDTLMTWIENACICAKKDHETLALMRDIGFARRRVRKVEKFRLIESNNELLYEVSLPPDAGDVLLISGSHKELKDSSPSVILCFVEQSE